jgi:radical SAM superfamily enzyme YgiQ (UPF0313 family)
MLPYATALLQAYALKHSNNSERFVFGVPVHTRMSVDDSVNMVCGNDVVGFSSYIWNEKLSLAIACDLKKKSPNTTIVFGGPQVPDDPEFFLRKHGFIDVLVHGEGEQTFQELIERTPLKDWSGIQGISYIDQADRFMKMPAKVRMNDLSSVPPVYSSGLFGPLMEKYPATQWAALLETNRGCPFTCTFCDWGSNTNSKVSRMQLENVFRELDWIAEHKIEYVFCCDANFGMLPRDEDIAEYVCQVRMQHGYPKVFATQNTKNSTERSYRIQKRLHEAGVNSGVTLSFQSLDSHTLKNVKRSNISLVSFSELQRRYTRDQIPTYTDMILALPGESLASFVRGIGEIVKQGQHNNLFFYNCSILPNAEMASPSYRERYGLQTVHQEIVPIHADLSEIDRQEVAECIETVVATHSMPSEDWIQAKVVWWLGDLVYFGRLLQIPLVLAQETFGIAVGEFLLALSRADRHRYPILGSILELFELHAQRIQSGQWEYLRSTTWLNLAWPANQFALIQLVTRAELGTFYAEVKEFVSQYVAETLGQTPSFALLEAIDFNHQLVRLPSVNSNLRIRLAHNHWEFYQGVLTGERVELIRKPIQYGVWRTQPKLLNLSDWLEFLVHCQNVKHNYLYPVVTLKNSTASNSHSTLSRESDEPSSCTP